MNYLANLLTGLSLVCGFLSIIFSLENHFTFSGLAIILSVIFDGLDGQVARLNPAPNEFGKELDSLVDVISFGVAPAILGYAFIYQDKHFYVWAAIILFIYLVCSVVRLVKYNITTKDKFANYFYGLPTTASGGALASFILIYRRYTQLPPPPRVFLLIVLGLAVLMVSRIKYPDLDALKELFGRSIIPVLLVALVIFLVLAAFYFISGVFLPEISLFTLFVIYLFSPLFLRKFRYNI